MSQFTSPFMAKSPIPQKGEIKNIKDFPGYQQVRSSSVRTNKIPFGPMAAGTAIATLIPSEKIYEKYSDGLTTATNYVNNSVIPKVKEIKAKVGGKIRKFLGEPEPTIKKAKDYKKLSKTKMK
mgnify:CR=1 FL=1